MIELNKKILEAIYLADCDENMKSFLREALKTEFEFVEYGKKRRRAENYKELIAEYANKD